MNNKAIVHVNIVENSIVLSVPIMKNGMSFVVKNVNENLKLIKIYTIAM